MKDAVREAGAIPPLLHLITDFPDAAFAEAASYAIGNLILRNDDNKAAIIEAGGVIPLLQLLDSGSEELRQSTFSAHVRSQGGAVARAC